MKTSSRTIAPAIRLAVALILMFAAGGLAFAQALPATDFYSDAPEADRAIVAKAEELAAQGKWASAWTALSEFDTTNSNPYVLAEKIRLALDGYAQTNLHLIFGFVDLAEGQDLEFARLGGIDVVEPVEFNPGDLAKVIEDKGEAVPPVLSMMLGDFYHSVWKNYEGQWIQDDMETLAMGAEQYERALAYDTFTAGSLDRQSEILVAMERFEAAESVIAKSLELQPDNNELNLRLADVYFATGRYADVYPLADKVIASPTDDNELNDAYITAIKTGLVTTDKETLERYMVGFEASFPGQYIPGLIRHIVAVQLGDAGAADAAADAVTAAFPGNPDVIRSLLSTWLSVNDYVSGFSYLDRTIAQTTDDEAFAALYFYRALLAGETAQTPEAIAPALVDLEKAEEYFRKTYPEGNEVFTMIEQLKAQWKDALNAAQAPAADTQPAAEAQPAADTQQPAVEPASPEPTATESTSQGTAAPEAASPEAASPEAASPEAGAPEADATSASTEW
ncbi:MAG: tetratricopeptide repeat protein [Rectinemataceae bacterium]